jgi:feruloyl-CoA synthase
MKDEPPVVLDWAPWHHTAGGNHVFFMVLTNGGELWVDDGRPTLADTPKTVRNLRDVKPTWYFNVPAGLDAIIPFLEQDAELRQAFFGRLKMLWYAGASLGQQSWDAIERMAVETVGARIQIGTGLGATETGPGALFCTWPQEMAGNVGLPAPGCTLKLVPMEGHLDARVKGPNIMRGYWRRPDLTPFDEEGFYKFGDALKPIDPEDLSRGFRFDGRTAENFKLTTGTWVTTGALRNVAVNHFGAHVRDLAVTAPDRPFLGALIFPPAPDLAEDPAWRARLGDLLKGLAAKATGSSNRIRRVLVIPDLPSLKAGEVTDKGSLNQRAVLAHRADLVDELYEGSPRTIDIED